MKTRSNNCQTDAETELEDCELALEELLSVHGGSSAGRMSPLIKSDSDGTSAKAAWGAATQVGRILRGQGPVIAPSNLFQSTPPPTASRSRRPDVYQSIYG